MKSDSKNKKPLNKPRSDFDHLKSYLKKYDLQASVKIGRGEDTISSTSGQRYEINEELERGGMGAILATQDLNIRRHIVTKVLLNTKSKSKTLRFIREAQINGQLEHPNIVPVHDLGLNAKGQIYFTMKWVKGENLKSIIKKLRKGDKGYQSKYKESDLLEIIFKVCDALSYAHSRGVIHRDLKPENIMVGEFGEVHLMDWGLAKVIGLDESELEYLEEGISFDDKDTLQTIDGSIMGTPQYMAPEQAKGDLKNINMMTDIYGIGGVLFSCLSYEAPVLGRSVDMILQRVIEGDLGRLPNSTASELKAIVKKAMSLKNTDRYQDIKEFSEDILAYTLGFSVSVKDDSFLNSLLKLAKRNKIISTGVLIGGLSLILGFSFSVQQWQKSLRQKSEAMKQKGISQTNIALALEYEKRIEVEKELGLENIAKEEQKQVAKDRALSRKLVIKAREFLSEARTIDYKVSRLNSTDKNKILYQAANWFRLALVRDSKNKDAVKGLRETALYQFELSLWLKAFDQAAANLSDLKTIKMDEMAFDELQARLDEAKSKGRELIENRVEYLMSDAKSLTRKVVHEVGSKELISMRDKLTIELLRPYVRSEAYRCQLLAIDSLSWMGDASVVTDILPYIKKVRPNQVMNNPSVQVAAVYAICLLKPKNKTIYDAVKKRIWAETNNTDSLLFAEAKLVFESYTEFISGMSQ